MASDSTELMLFPVEDIRFFVDKFSYRVTKRILDLALCILILPLAGILMLGLALYVLVSAGWPIFYKQQRVGQHGRLFTLYKLRTMHMDGPQILSEWFKTHPEDLLEWRKNQKLKRDPRITRGGRFFRTTSLDELPQIFNILRGDMSVVGPRPITEAELEKYSDRVGYYLAAVPGLTGLWQVSGRCNVSYEERVELDKDYVVRWSFGQDLRILLKTPLSVFRRDGAL